MNKVLLTIYINNLNESMNFSKLKLAVKSLFSQYGKIINFNMKKNIILRGQAFITYDNNESAINSIEKLNEYILFSKKINVCFAKTESDKGNILLKNDINRNKKNLIYIPKIKNKIINNNIDINENNDIKNNILFIKNLPKDLEIKKLIDIFEYYEGFKEVRYFAPKQIAFIEFVKILQAEYVKKKLSNKRIYSD